MSAVASAAAAPAPVAAGAAEVATQRPETVGMSPCAQPRIEKISARGAMQALEAMREDVEKGRGAGDAIAHCYLHGIPHPDWLQSVFLRGRDLLRRAKVASWDAVLGQYWPEGTRLEEAAQRIELGERICLAVAELAAEDPSRAINRDFFEQIGERPEICRSGSTVERHYYRLVREGRAVNLIALRAANPHHTPSKLRTELPSNPLNITETL